MVILIAKLSEHFKKKEGQMSMEDEKKDVVEVKAEEKTASNETPKQENDPDHDHHQAIHGFWGSLNIGSSFRGLSLSAASLTLLVIFAILAEHWHLKTIGIRTSSTSSMRWRN
jgi:hypothetical protein